MEKYLIELTRFEIETIILNMSILEDLSEEEKKLIEKLKKTIDNN